MSGGDDKRPIVLLVDDEPAMRLIALEALEGGGFEVIEASGGAEALERFTAARPALVLLDLVMPDMDGLATLAALRALPGGAHLPVLVMPARDDGAAIDRAYELGATDFITKPINYGLLVHRLRYLLRAARLVDDAREDQRRLAQAHRIARIADWQWHLADGRLQFSTEMAELFGLPAPPSGAGPGALLAWVHPSDRGRVERTFAEALANPAPFRLEYRLVAPDGTERMASQEAELAVDPITGATRFVGAVQDITAVKEAERKILEMAYYDGLTGLPNRTLLREQLGRCVAEARRYKRTLAVLGLDLDLFKRINDTMGHAVGDRVLKEAASRMARGLRGSDTLGREAGVPDEILGEPEPDTVARVGGDEFVAVLAEVRAPEDAAVAARRLMAELAQPFHLDGGAQLFITASIGIAIYPADGDNAETLLKHAELAMYHAKEAGRNRFQFYTEAMNEGAHKRLSIENGLRVALERGEFVLHYQPRVRLEDGRLESVEALIRWIHPQRGMVPPMEFIPTAEDTGIIVPLGAWVLRTACAQARRWSEELANPLRVAVNISARQFAEADLMHTIAGALRDTGLPPSLLEVEITEGVVMQDTGASKTLLAALQALGVRVALDDFGTGYSSLSYLTQFPIDTLKVDRAFVKDVLTSKTSATITSAIIALSRSLALNVVAEGIETQDQLTFLRENGCAEGQGYLIARPMPAADLVAWIRRREGETSGKMPAPPALQAAR